MTETVEADGETRIHDHYVICAPIAGRLLPTDLHAGESVAQGETVAKQLA